MKFPSPNEAGHGLEAFVQALRVGVMPTARTRAIPVRGASVNARGLTSEPALISTCQ